MIPYIQKTKASLTSRRACNYEWFACENYPSSTMHAGVKYFFWWSQTGRRARSLKTGQPVFCYDLTATICTSGARSEYARLKYLGSLIGVRVTQAKHTAIPGYFPHEGVLTTQGARTLHLLLMYVLTKRWWAHFLRAYYLATFKVHGEYYYRTCEVRHTQTTHVSSTITHVSSTIKVCQKYAHNDRNSESARSRNARRDVREP
jgi:hypothetical protein